MLLRYCNCHHFTVNTVNVTHTNPNNNPQEPPFFNEAARASRYQLAFLAREVESVSSPQENVSTTNTQT